MTELEKLIKETSDSLEVFTGDVKHILNHLAAQGRIVPDGWQAVPKEPTGEQLKAIDDCEIHAPLTLFYQAMLAASPKPFESEEK